MERGGWRRKGADINRRVPPVRSREEERLQWRVMVPPRPLVVTPLPLLMLLVSAPAVGRRLSTEVRSDDLLPKSFIRDVEWRKDDRPIVTNH